MGSIIGYFGLSSVHSAWLDGIVMAVVFLGALGVNWILLSIGQFYLSTSFKDLSKTCKLRRHFSPWSSLFLFSLFFRSVLPLLYTKSHFIEVVRQLMFIFTMVCGGFFFARAIRLIKILLSYQFNLKITDNIRLRAFHTQMVFVEKVFFIVIGLTVFCVTLASFESAREIGGSILASAGIMGIVAGFAAQKSLGNLFAGFQIAFTQPIRLDDIVVVDGQWGKIEEITFTYVVVVTWDLRRLVVPINAFIEKSFENWTRSNSHLLSYILLNVDYSVPIEVLRKEFKQILEQTDLWDRKVSAMQMTDNTEHTVVIRALMSAETASKAFDLKCVVREKLVDFLLREYPNSLPRLRLGEAGLAKNPPTVS